jgi:O-antigen ligase
MASRKNKRSNTTHAVSPDFLSYLLIGSCILIIPFLFSARLLDPVLSLRFTAFSVSLTIMLFLTAIYDRSGLLDLSILRRRIFPIFLFYAGVSALSLLGAINVLEGFFELLKLCVGIVFLCVAALIFANTPKSISRLTKAIIIASAASAVIGICQYYGVAFDFLPGYYLIYGTMVNKNLFASFLFLTLPFSFYGFFVFRDNWDMLGGLSSILSLWCIFLVASRAVWLAVAVAGIVVGICALLIFRKSTAFRKEKGQLITRGVIFLVVLSALVVFSYPDGSEARMKEASLQEKLSSAANVGAGSAQVRLELWKKTLSMISDHPVLGVGLGNWKINIPRYGTNGLPSEQGKVQYIRPHNDFLWVLAESGTLALLAYLALFGISIYYLFKTIRRSKTWEDQLFQILILSGIVGFLVISWFSFPKERIVHSTFIYFFLVIVSVKYHQEFKTEQTGLPVPVQPLLLVSSIVLILSVVVGFQRMRSEAHLLKAYDSWDKNQWERMNEEAEKAESAFVNLDHNATPVYWLRGIAYLSLGQKEKALEELISASKAHPYHIQVLDNLATCYELLADHTNAIKYYNQVIEISPHFENSLRNLSVIYYNMGKYEEALAVCSQADLYSGNHKLLQYLEIYRTKIEQMNR